VLRGDEVQARCRRRAGGVVVKLVGGMEKGKKLSSGRSTTYKIGLSG